MAASTASTSSSSSSLLVAPASLTSPFHSMLPFSSSASGVSVGSLSPASASSSVAALLPTSLSAPAPHALDPQFLALETVWREKVRSKNCACKLMTRAEVERIIQILEGILTPRNFNEKVKIKKFSVGVNEAGQRLLYRNAERGRKGVQYAQRIVVACEDLYDLLRQHHDLGSVLNLRHVGFQKTVHQLRESYYGLDDDVVKAYIQHCALCKLSPPAGEKGVKSENGATNNSAEPSPSSSASSALLSLSSLSTAPAGSSSAPLPAPSTFTLPFSVPNNATSQGSGNASSVAGIPAFLSSPSSPSSSSSSSAAVAGAPCCLNCTSACAGWTHHFAAGPSFEDFRRRFSQFSCIRNWYQYHTPRNLLLALTGEVGELAELFQWRNDTEAGPMLPGFSFAERDAVAEELSDIALYLIRLADRCGVDLPRAMERKLEKNARKYPAEIVFGSHAKYTAYQQNSKSKKRKGDHVDEEDNEEGAAAENGAAANANGIDWAAVERKMKSWQRKMNVRPARKSNSAPYSMCTCGQGPQHYAAICPIRAMKSGSDDGKSSSQSSGNDDDKKAEEEENEEVMVDEEGEGDEEEENEEEEAGEEENEEENMEMDDKAGSETSATSTLTSSASGARQARARKRGRF